MWVICRDGFYSVVEYDPRRDTKKIRPDAEPGLYVLVRTRSEDDVKVLAKWLDRDDYLATPNGDYAFRMVLSKNEWTAFMAAEIRTIDYANFKNTIKDDRRHSIYMRVWSRLLDIQGPYRMTRINDSGSSWGRSYGSGNEPRIHFESPGNPTRTMCQRTIKAFGINDPWSEVRRDQIGTHADAVTCLNCKRAMKKAGMRPAARTVR